MKRFATAALAAALLSTTAFSQQAQRLEATKANEYGLTYSLPLTALTVTVEAEITRQTPGEFANYASKYLSVSDPIIRPATSVRLKSITLSTSGVSNPAEKYLITLKGGQNPYILINEDNIALAINTEEVYEPSKPILPTARAAAPTPLETPAASQVVTREMQQSHSPAKRAELAAQLIYDLRQSRSDIITGQADQMPADGAAMQLVLDNLNAQESALMAMFVGTTAVSTDVASFTIVPEEDITNQVIARISAINGVVPPSDLSGLPINLTLTVTERGQLPVNEKGETIPFPKGGIAYCIPGKATVEVACEGKVFANEDFEFAQFGTVYGLSPSALTNKKSPAYVIFNPVTGAVSKTGPVEQ